MKKKIFLTLTVVISLFALAGLVTICGWFVFRKSVAVPLYRSQSRVLNKLTTNNISEAYSPVLIYRYHTLIRSGTPIGVGTTFVTKAGEERLLTAAHIFRKRRSDASFVIRRLRPLDVPRGKLEGIEAFISMLSSNGYLIEGVSDFALCRVGEIKPVGWLPRSELFMDFNANFSLFPEAKRFFVTSLVSGKRVPVIGATEPAADGLKSYLAIYRSVSGESGTGFVDNGNRMFVLTSQVRGRSPIHAGFPGASRVPEESSLSLLVGPFEPE